MKVLKEYRFLFLIPVFYISGVFTVIFIARAFAVAYYFGIKDLDFMKEVARAGEIGIKIGGLVSAITCACIIFEKYKKKVHQEKEEKV